MIQKVWKQKKNNVKLVTIPKDSEVVEGDYVYIEKVKKHERKD